MSAPWSEAIQYPSAVTALPRSSPAGSGIILWLLLMVIGASGAFPGAEPELRPEKLCLKSKSEQSVQI